jgi:phospholipase/carboxylesterase
MRAHRRQLLIVLLAALAVLGLAVGGAAIWRQRPDVPVRPEHRAVRLTSRPLTAVTGPPLAPGSHPLGLGRRRDGRLLVPKSLPGQGPVGLLVFLHGHSNTGDWTVEATAPSAEREGILVLAPSSRRSTWNRREPGRDVAFLDGALARVFERYMIDRRRLVLAGYSDGGTFALQVGLANGDLFSHVIALAAEKLVPAPRSGRPPVLVLHARGDTVHPIDATSRRIVPALRAAGYQVTYEEPEGGHWLTPEMIPRAFAWTSPAR